MTAFEIPNMRFSLSAGGTVARRRFVKVDSNGNGVQAGAGEAVVGGSMVDVAANEVLEVANGIIMIEAGAAVTAGVAVEADADGKAIAKTTGVQAGTAFTSAGAAGQLIAVLI